MDYVGFERLLVELNGGRVANLTLPAASHLFPTDASLLKKLIKSQTQHKTGLDARQRVAGLESPLKSRPRDPVTP